ncbi:MAG: GNAT family N-acetyltransferase [Rhodobacteraceae bacterium]|nr:MAG: GNAT family N-acetyltransferase [Paracoccaceae bacterium]
MALMRCARANDAPAIAAFLAPRIATSMFLLSNLEAHGLDGSAHPHATRYLLDTDAQGALVGVLGCTQGGYLMCQHPGLTRQKVETFLTALGAQRLLGVTGEAAQVAQIIAALNARGADWLKDSAQPLFTRSLDDLTPPVVALRRPDAHDRAMLVRWFAQYLRETGQPATGDDCDRAAMHALTQGQARLLEGPDGTAIGMTIFNARAGDAVQVGGVFVQPAHRGQGHSGRMVAAHLWQARAQGVRRALLFATSVAAARAYQRIGFRQIGSYRIAMLANPLPLGAAA